MKPAKAQHTLRTGVCTAALGAAMLLSGCTAAERPLPAPAYWPTDGWRTATPESQGLDSAKLAAGLLAIRERELSIHSLLLVRNGYVVLDATFYPYDGSALHQLESVTKSVTTTLIAIAADQGKLKLDDPMVSFFPGRAIANRDARKDHITVRHLVTMSSGLDCTAEHDEPTLEAMKGSANFVQFALDLPMSAEPGSTFAYCSPGMHLLSAILQEATGMNELDFAREYLFKPLGIGDVMWKADAQGYSHGWADLYLHPQDAAKLGFLWANGGAWADRQIVSRAWVEDSVKVQVRTGGRDDYGYGWWLPTKSTTGEYAAVGRGGQRVAVHRDLNLVVAITGGSLEPADATDLIAPAMVDRERALPENTAGLEKLNAALATIRRPPAAHAVPPAPATAREVSGKTWLFDPNPKNLKSVRLDFSASAEAMIDIRFCDGQATRSGRVGLDGVYRIGPGRDRLPSGFRGSWLDAKTFVVDFDEIANREAFMLQFHFEGPRLTLDVHERTHEAGFTVEATAGT